MLQRIKKLVSIIVSNYNNEQYIEKCLDSLINQTYKNIEIIIVDDASTDNSIEVIENWKSKQSKSVRDIINVIRLTVNVGFSGSVTTGLFLSKGEYIAMQDSDDYSHPKRIEKQVEYLNNNLNINAVGTDYEIFEKNNDTPKHLFNGLAFGVDNIKEVYASGKNAVCYGSLLIRGNIFDNVGGLTRKINGAEDYEFITKLIPTGLDNIKEVLYYYRHHGMQRSQEFYGIKEVVSKSRDELSVLMVLDSLNIGGTETHVLSLTKELIKKGIKVTILAGEGALSSEFNNLNCKVYSMVFPTTVVKDKLIIERYKERIGRIIKLENINVIHSHQSPSGALALEVSKEFNIPSIFTVHGLYYHDIVSTKLPLFSKVIAVSLPVYEWLLKFNVNSTVIPNGIDFSNVKEINKKSIREGLNIPEDAVVALYCSRLAWGKIKTCENIIRSCRDLIRMEDYNIHALIVGDGPGYEELYRSAKRANNVLGGNYIHMIGGKTNLEEYYGICDCVVGTGRVAIEGIAAKKTVIATGNDGYCGILNSNNFNESWKIYFGDHKSNKINNAAFLYEDLKYFYNNLEEVKSETEKLYNIAKEKFDVNIVSEQVIEAYLNSF